VGQTFVTLHRFSGFTPSPHRRQSRRDERAPVRDGQDVRMKQKRTKSAHEQVRMAVRSKATSDAVRNAASELRYAEQRSVFARAVRVECTAIREQNRELLERGEPANVGGDEVAPGIAVIVTARTTNTTRTTTTTTTTTTITTARIAPLNDIDRSVAHDHWNDANTSQH
jgi:hypothetical protein